MAMSNFQRVNQGFNSCVFSFLLGSPAKHGPHMSCEAGATVEIYEAAETGKRAEKPLSCVLSVAMGFMEFYGWFAIKITDSILLLSTNYLRNQSDETVT